MGFRALPFMFALLLATTLAHPHGTDRSSYPPTSRFEFTRLLMGVRARIVLWAADEHSAGAAARSAFARIARLDEVMSDYRQDSELARLNERAGGDPVTVSDDLFRVLDLADRISARSDGAFDPTVGPVVRLWRQARSSGRLPPEDALKKARGLVGWRRFVRLDPDARTVTLARSGMRLDLGGIGKGFAADEALAVLRRAGLTRCLVDLGGDIVAGDPPPGQAAWTIRIADDGPAIGLVDATVATSGDCEQFVQIADTRYSHIVDPATGIGLTNRAQVTVIAPDGATADALASALSVLGSARAGSVLERFPGAAARIRTLGDDAGTVWTSPGFDALPVGAGAQPSADVKTPPPGFVALFNGADLSGWKGLVADPIKRVSMSPDDLAKAQAEADRRMREHWSVVDGVLTFDGKGDSLVSGRDYGDFELYLDWKIEPGGDSGIYLRGSPQVQIWDNPIGSGGLYNNQANPSEPLVVADNPPGQWNTFHITMIGQRVSVELNGKLVVDDTVLENYWQRDRAIFDSGPIELQNHHSRLWFRNIFIREIARTADAARDDAADEPDAGAARSDTPVVGPIAQGETGSITLRAIDAQVPGDARYEPSLGGVHIGNWTEAGQPLSWEFFVDRTGRFRVQIEYACEPGEGGSTFVVSVAGRAVVGKVEPTRSGLDFVSHDLGVVSIDRRGTMRLSITPRSVPYGVVMNLRRIRLVPTQ